jgi:hypothetical protein
MFTRTLHLSLSSARSVEHISPQFHFNIIPHQSLGLPGVLFPSGFYTKLLYSLIFCPMCATYPLHLILDLIVLIILGERVQVVEILIMQFSLTSSAFISLRSKHSPQHPVLKHPQSMFLPECSKFSFIPIQNCRQKLCPAHFNFYVLKEQTKRQKAEPKSSKYYPNSVCP